MKTKPAKQKPIDPPDPEVDPNALEIVNEPAASSARDPEVTAQTEAITEWDTPPTAAGAPAARAGMEDEATISETLTEEGVEEADRDQRLAAADPDYEP